MLLAPSAWAALAGAAVLGAMFVGSLYVWKNAIQLDHDDGRQIKQRILSVTVVSLLSPVVVWAFGAKAFSPQDAGPSWLVWFGLTPSLWSHALAVLSVLALTCTLFLGPLYLYVLTLPGSVSGAMTQIAHDARDHFILIAPSERLVIIRNVVVAPLAEEWVFRSCVCTLLYAGGWSFTATILLSPVIFGLAHVHHLIGLVKMRGLTVLQASMQIVFQLSYTTIFGCYAGFLFLRTGSFFSALAAHALCNHMGFPSFGWLSSAHPFHARKTTIGCVFVSGLLGFLLLARPLTDPTLFDSFFFSSVFERLAAMLKLA